MFESLLTPAPRLLALSLLRTLEARLLSRTLIVALLLRMDGSMSDSAPDSSLYPFAMSLVVAIVVTSLTLWLAQWTARMWNRWRMLNCLVELLFRLLLVAGVLQRCSGFPFVSSVRSKTTQRYCYRLNHGVPIV